jgi:hypothetical protein
MTETYDEPGDARILRNMINASFFPRQAAQLSFRTRTTEVPICGLAEPSFIELISSLEAYLADPGLQQPTVNIKGRVLTDLQTNRGVLLQKFPGATKSVPRTALVIGPIAMNHLPLPLGSLVSVGVGEVSEPDGNFDSQPISSITSIGFGRLTGFTPGLEVNKDNASMQTIQHLATKLINQPTQAAA